MDIKYYVPLYYDERIQPSSYEKRIYLYVLSDYTLLLFLYVNVYEVSPKR